MTNGTKQLAILGGTPAFPEPLHVGRPNIGDRARLMSRINDMLDRRWLTNNGPYVQELEQRLQLMLGVKHCIAMCNATVALEISIRALGMRGEVIIPSFTFIATAHALQWQEITPVFCDIDSSTHLIDPSKVEALITPRTTGIIGVHVWGRPCNVSALEDISKQHNLKLLFDAAHAFSCAKDGTYIGNFGDAEVFSFHATKFFNSFEGGVVATNNDELAARIRLMKNFGFSGYDNVVFIGTNGKMSEVSAAMALTSLESLDTFIATNKANYDAYAANLKSLKGIKLIQYNEKEINNYQYIVIEVDGSEAGITRDDLIQTLHAENIIARRYFYPGCHNMEPYRSYFPHSHLLLSTTERVASSVIVLPTGTSVTRNDIDTICSIIANATNYSSAIRSRLNGRV